MRFTRTIEHHTEVYSKTGVIKEHNQFRCLRCTNHHQRLFYSYTDDLGVLTYCLHCIALGRSDTRTPLKIVTDKRYKEELAYTLDFQLNEAQKAAQNRIIAALNNHQDLMVYAVTGAGKTEITFAGIHYARKHGLNVLFVSPRVDVVREIYLRCQRAFKTATIDLLYGEEKIEKDFVFTTSTVHQLYNFRDHYDFIIVDEVDAFPLTKEKMLQKQIELAKRQQGTIVYLTATPNRAFIKKMGKDHIVSITRRYHNMPLVIPKIYYTDVFKHIKKSQLPKMMLKQLQASMHSGDRKVLIFVPEIHMLAPIFKYISKLYKNTEYVYSGDALRKEKIERMRRNKIDIMITTTILERGVTFKKLDVFIIHGEYFDSASLIQIAGRAGRQLEDTEGNVYIFTKYNTRDIVKALDMTYQFNRGKIKL